MVWEGLSTAHVKQSLDGNVTLDELRRMWLPISPLPFIERVRGRKILLVYARYDLTFPVHLSQMLVERVPSTRHSAPAGDPAVRSLQHGCDAVQMDGRNCVVSIPESGAVSDGYRYFIKP